MRSLSQESMCKSCAKIPLRDLRAAKSDTARTLQGSNPTEMDRQCCTVFVVTIFDNAITSIQLALEDFSAATEARLLSTVRNLHAGILLLYKSKLSALSPPGSGDALVKKSVVPKKLPSGEVVFTGVGRKTANVLEIRTRFESLGVQTDWKRFEKISALRNDIEHYCTSVHPDAIRGMISDTFVIIRDFMHSELAKDPKDELGEEAWARLLSVSEVFERERADCKQRVESIDWESATLEEAISEVTCHACGSGLITPVGSDKTTGVQCRSCGEVEQFEPCAARALSDYLSWRNHYALKDGAEEALIMCPFCFQEGYVVDEECCAICGESCEHTCAMCASTIPISELSDGSLCGYCQHMVDKDD